MTEQKLQEKTEQGKQKKREWLKMHNFRKSELWLKIEECVRSLDMALEKNFLSIRDQRLAEWNAYQTALKFIFGVEYHFIRTDEYFGIETTNGKDCLFRVLRENGQQVCPTPEAEAKKFLKVIKSSQESCEEKDFKYTCPRCGGKMKKDMAQNPLSKDVDVHICNECKEDERLMYALGISMMFGEWECFQA